MTAFICNYWTDNGTSSSPTVLGEYISNILHIKRERARTLVELEERATTLEAEFFSTPDDAHYLPWQEALCDLSAARQEETNRALLYWCLSLEGKNGKLLA